MRRPVGLLTFLRAVAAGAASSTEFGRGAVTHGAVREVEGGHGVPNDLFLGVGVAGRHVEYFETQMRVGMERQETGTEMFRLRENSAVAVRP